jgi:hypothetical protein
MQDSQDKKQVRMKYRAQENTKKKKNLVGARYFSIFQNVRTASWAHPAFSLMRTGFFFSGLNRSGLEVNLLPLSSAASTFTSVFVFQPILTHRIILQQL